ncbi:ATP-binding protein [Bacteroidota bacterium]
MSEISNKYPKFEDYQEFIDKINENGTSPGSSDYRTKNLEIVLDISKKMNQSLVVNDVLENVLKAAIQISNTDRGFIVLKDKKGKLEFTLCLDSAGNKLPKSLFRISTSVVEEAFFTNQSRFIERALSDTNFSPSKSILAMDLQTILCSPLNVNKKRIGVIYVDSKKVHNVKIKEITDTFEILASQAAIAINNAQLYNSQLTANNKLEKLNQELYKAKEKLEKSDRLKTEFLRQVSHEVRTPLNTLFGATALLGDMLLNKSEDEVQEIYEIIEDSGNKITRTIDDIIAMSKIQTEDYDFHPTSVNLEEEVISKILQQFKRESEYKNLEFSFINLSKSRNVYVDKYMIDKVFTVLIDNAIKYTNKGNIFITQYDNELNQLCVDVKDSGIGIDPNYLTQIFTPFSQEDSGATRTYQGMGLQLAIAKNYLDINGAEINITSQKGKGTTFTIIFNNHSDD